MYQSISTPIFATIPPERVGLRGEYDHHGLAKRVKAAFDQQFEPGDIGCLKIHQRGAVVVLIGEVPNQRLVSRLVAIAMGVHGAVGVEINGNIIFQSPKCYSSDLDYLKTASLAF